MLTKSKIRELHDLAQSLREPEDFVQAYKVLVAHHPRTRERRYKRRTARVAAFQAMSLDDRAQFIEKRQLAHAEQQSAKRAASAKKREENRANLSKLRDQIIEQGFTPLFCHYHISYKNKRVNLIMGERLVATTCVLVDEHNNPISKGVALTSPRDNPNKLEGRGLALDRAIEAATRQDTYYPVSRAEARWVTHYFRNSDEVSAWANKAVYMPGKNELTAVEIDRMESRKTRTDVKQATT